MLERVTERALGEEARRGRPLNDFESEGVVAGFLTLPLPLTGRGTTSDLGHGHAQKGPAAGTTLPCWDCCSLPVSHRDL